MTKWSNMIMQWIKSTMKILYGPNILSLVKPLPTFSTEASTSSLSFSSIRSFKCLTSDNLIVSSNTSALNKLNKNMRTVLKPSIRKKRISCLRRKCLRIWKTKNGTTVIIKKLLGTFLLQKVLKIIAKSGLTGIKRFITDCCASHCLMNPLS